MSWLNRKPEPISIEIVHPPSMVEVRDALLSVRDAKQALERAEQCWNAVQLEDALRSAKFFIDDARKRLSMGIAKRAKETS